MKILGIVMVFLLSIPAIAQTDKRRVMASA
jgi:NADH:ubiquinone oxidoreductase subunit 4 (subunit M)